MLTFLNKFVIKNDNDYNDIMYELCPYFTNDGTVGLFSRSDDDIYHSTYGALTESWQKFILPAHFKEYLTTHKDVKILDICYGIGYNTKTALNVFIQNAEEFQKNKNFLKNNFIKISKNSNSATTNIEAIYTDNIDKNNCGVNLEKNIKKEHESSTTIEAGGSDNISDVNIDYETIKNETEQEFYSEQKCTCDNILIDAIDLDSVLINLSPFITRGRGRKSCLRLHNYIYDKYIQNSNSKNKLQQVHKIINSNLKPLNNKFKLKQEVQIILLKNLLEQNPSLPDDKILKFILSKDKNSPFLSRYMINLANFFSNLGYNSNQNKNKMTFLHNIYYRYISKSYKNAIKLLAFNQIKLDFHHEDARCFIKKTSDKYNFIFLDAFTPAKCPSLWTVQFFAELYSNLEDDGMILTYSNSAAVRNAFLQNGFCVGKTYDSNLKKFVGTVAVKNISLIEHPLDERDLDLINSKAGICFNDKDLNLDNETIIKNREEEIMHSDLISSSRVLKEYKNGNIKSL